MASATAIATADALLDAWASHGQLAHSAKALETSDDTASWAEDWEEADALAVHWLSLRAPLPGSRAPRAPSRQPNSSRAAGRRPAIAVGADESVQMSLRAFDADGAAPQAMQGGRKGGRPCMQLKASALLCLNPESCSSDHPSRSGALVPVSAMSCTREAGVISILALGLLVASATAAPAGAGAKEGERAGLAPPRTGGECCSAAALFQTSSGRRRPGMCRRRQPSRAGRATALPNVAAAAAAAAVPPELLPAAVQWRGLLQADGSGGSGVKTAVIFNLNTKGQPVFCINVRATLSRMLALVSGQTQQSSSRCSAPICCR